MTTPTKGTKLNIKCSGQLREDIQRKCFNLNIKYRFEDGAIKIPAATQEIISYVRGKTQRNYA